MKKNSLIYFTLSWLLIQLLLDEGNCQVTNFKPVQRHDHTATIIDNRLYILGGSGYNGDHEFFYLDFSIPISDPLKLSWQDLSNNNIVPSHYGAASVKAGANNNTLFVYGVYNNAVYTYDPQSNSWNYLQITGDNAIRKQFLTGIIDYNGTMYLFGETLSSSGSDNILDADMFILDTTNLSPRKGNLDNAPKGRSDYGATLLHNQSIIYLGCFNSNKTFAFSEVHLYDTINDEWSIKTASGKIPSNRDYISAVLGLDGNRVIIFGGRGTTDLNDTDSLYELDLTNLKWYVPAKISGNVPKPRFWHKANVFKNYMIVSFGCCYNQSIESDILLLDISNTEDYKWINTTIT